MTIVFFQSIINKSSFKTYIFKANLKNMPRIAIDIQPPYNTELFFWKITETAEELSELTYGGQTLLNEAQRKFKSEERRKEWLATRALLQSTPYKKCKIVYGNNGAPMLTDSDRHIGISHTKELVAIAISDTHIGIDIEFGERDALKVAKLFLTEKECGTLDNNKDEALRLWTTKEAAFKLASENATVLKDIETEFKGTENGEYIYKIKYTNQKSAICRTYMTNGLFISVSSLQE